MITPVLIMAFVASVLFHAYLEYKEGLAQYLGNIIGFDVPFWLPISLFSLAILNLLIPFTLGVFLSSNALIVYVIGGLIGDSLGTHIIPSLLLKKTAPATLTTILYFFLAFMLGTAVAFNFLAFILGFGSFIVLWPALWLYKKFIVGF